MKPWNKPLVSLQNLAIQTVALVVLAGTGIPAAKADNPKTEHPKSDSLGRLFFTPAQRIQLDYAYARSATAEGGSSPFLTVNGIVQKHGGARTVWINGVAQSARNSNESNPTAQTVTVPGKSQPVKIKVGEKILLDQPAPTKQDAPVE